MASTRITYQELLIIRKAFELKEPIYLTRYGRICSSKYLEATGISWYVKVPVSYQRDGIVKKKDGTLANNPTIVHNTFEQFLHSIVKAKIRRCYNEE